jgi:hypothetical protein
MISVDEPLHHLDDGANLFGGSWVMRSGQDIERSRLLEPLGDEVLGQRIRVDVLRVRPIDDLVVDVGEVLNVLTSSLDARGSGG